MSNFWKDVFKIHLVLQNVSRNVPLGRTTLIKLFQLKACCVVNEKGVFIYLFQNGFISAIPFLCMYIIGIGGGQLADWLRFNKILSTGEVRKVFATGGEYIRCTASLRKTQFLETPS